MSQFHVDVGIDFEGNVKVLPRVGKERIDNESESEVCDSVHIPNESNYGKKKKQRFTEFNSANDMDNPKLKGVVEGLPEVFPHSEHRTCVRYLYMNFKLKFTDKALKDALWKPARATYLREFEVVLSEMKALSPKAHEWLVGKDPRKFSKSHFSCNNKCDMLLYNLCVGPLMLVDTSFRFHLDHTLNMQWTCLSIHTHAEVATDSSNPKLPDPNDPFSISSHNGKVGKKGLRMNCCKCGKSGHNVRTCKGVIGGNSQLNRKSSVHPQTQPSRGRKVPNLRIKKTLWEYWDTRCSNKYP
ncbi:hypothetical protein GQ457_02G022090 [Hibiscus cannabinus]